MGADGSVDSILVPIAGGPHAGLAIETAGAFARETKATIHAVYVIDPDASEETRQIAESMLADRTASVQDVGVEMSLLESDDVVSALVEESTHHDRTIIGATREGIVQKFVFGSIPETIAERAPTTVIMAKRDLDVGTRLQQSLDKLRTRLTGTSDVMEQADRGADSRD